MRLVDKDQMIAIDNYAINQLMIPSLCLVERASLAVIKNINLDVRRSFAVIVSTGNNGADGLAVARNLLARKFEVEVYIIGDIANASPEFTSNYEAITKLSDKIFTVETIGDLETMEENIKNLSTIIEGIFGTGLNRTISGVHAFVIAMINRSMKFVISIDIPSGLDATSGESWGEMVDADLIVSMQLMKKGIYQRSRFRDICVVEDIGIPELAIEHVLNNNHKSLD